MALVFGGNRAGLVHKVIAIGGSAFSPAAFQWNPGKQAVEFAESAEIKCNERKTDRLVNCLRLIDARVLVAASRKSHDFERNSFRFWFRPVVDKNSTHSLIRDSPHALYRRGGFLRVPLMAGLTTSEGSLEFFLHYDRMRAMSSLERIQFLVSPYLYEFARAEIVATTLDYQYVRRLNTTGFALTAGSQLSNQRVALNSDPIVIATRITSHGAFWHEQNLGLERNNYDVYISPNDFRSREIVREIDAIGDFLVTAPLIKQLELHSQLVTQTYLFVFDYKGGKSFGHIQLNPNKQSFDGEVLTNGWLPSSPTSSGALISTETSNFGVAHCDDLFYVLPNDFSPHPGDLRMQANGLTGQLAFAASALATPNNAASASAAGDYSANDDNVIRNYVTYLAAFASRVNEHKSAANNLANWLPFRATDRNFMRFSEQQPALYKNFHQSDASFVNELVEPIEELVNTPLPLFPYEELRDYKVSTFSLALLLLLLLLTLLLSMCALSLAATAARRRRARIEALKLNVTTTTTTTTTQEETSSTTATSPPRNNGATDEPPPNCLRQPQQTSHTSGQSTSSESSCGGGAAHANGCRQTPTLRTTQMHNTQQARRQKPILVTTPTPRRAPPFTLQFAADARQSSAEAAVVDLQEHSSASQYRQLLKSPASGRVSRLSERFEAE